MIQVYGIPNCDSVKKVRALLDARKISYAFHDYKKSGVPEVLLRDWVNTKGWEALLNRRGTTWRALNDATRESVVDAETAIAVMIANPSAIKRPVVTKGAAIFVGLDESVAAFGQ